MLEPASKDDLGKYYRTAIYELQNGVSTDSDPHLGEKLCLIDKIKGWDETLVDDENDAPIPFNASSLASEVNTWDQSQRDEVYFCIVNSAKNRAKLVAAEKNG